MKLIGVFALFISTLLLATASYADTVVLKQGVGGYTGATDAYIDSQSPDSNFGSTWYMHVYMYDDAPRRSGLIKFDLTGKIPQNAVIQSAYLSLWVYQVVDMDTNDWIDVGLYRISTYRPWVENQATWNRFTSTYYWGLPGCEHVPSDRSGTYDGSVIRFTKNSQVNQYYTWNVTSSVQAWYSGTTNNGWLVRAAAHDGAAGEGVSFNTKEGDLAYRPYLTINYTIIPEPSTIVGLTFGLLPLIYFKKRR